MMLVPAPWRAAFGAAKAYKIGSEQPLSGPGAAGGKTAVVGLQMAADRINTNGGINGRPVELVIVDDEVQARRRRAARPQKMVDEDNIDVHVGGFLSNICLACMPVWQEAKIVNMITRVPRHHADHHAPATATASACTTTRRRRRSPSRPTLTKMGKKWHIAYADYSWGQSTRDAYVAEIKKNGGEVVGTTGIPLGTADMTPFLSKISGNFDGLFGIFFGKDGVTHRQPGLRSRPDQEVQMGRRRLDHASRPTCWRSATRSTASSASTATSRCSRARSTRRSTTSFFDEAKKRLAKIDPSGPLPDKYVQSNYEALNAMKIAHGEVEVRQAARTR